jgi:hypothetical protein
MHNHRYCSPMRSMEMKGDPSLFLWSYMQNHRYFYGPSATTAKPKEKNSDGLYTQTCVHLLSTPIRHERVRALSIIAMLSSCPTTPISQKKKTRLQENTILSNGRIFWYHNPIQIAHRCMRLLLWHSWRCRSVQLP